MMDWRRTVVAANSELIDAINTINETAIQIALVLDDAGRLLGTLTDGDIRRAVLSKRVNSRVSEIMNREPMTAPAQSSREHLLAVMRRHTYHHLPLVDDTGVVVGLASLDELVGVMPRENWVVLMAGGLGKRLRPLTENCPKPMLNVGGRPILETIVEAFAEQGYRRFYFSVNFKAEQIVDYFQDGSKWGVEIRYLHETMELGTAGALSLLPERPRESMLVMNGDLLTKLDIDSLLKFHAEHGAAATMAVRAHEYQVPFGVVQMDEFNIRSIVEKPSHNYFVNAGIYALSPEALDFIPQNAFFDMPSLYQKLIEQERVVKAYPMKEYWLDIGRLHDFERAQEDYRVEFS
jgi:dTDP-glucose pyrophosphorylase/CBS domain-containing protein